MNWQRCILWRPRWCKDVIKMFLYCIYEGVSTYDEDAKMFYDVLTCQRWHMPAKLMGRCIDEGEDMAKIWKHMDTYWIQFLPPSKAGLLLKTFEQSWTRALAGAMSLPWWCVCDVLWLLYVCFPIAFHMRSIMFHHLFKIISKSLMKTPRLL